MICTPGCLTARTADGGDRAPERKASWLGRLTGRRAAEAQPGSFRPFATPGSRPSTADSASDAINARQRHRDSAEPAVAWGADDPPLEGPPKMAANAEGDGGAAQLQERLSADAAAAAAQRPEATSGGFLLQLPGI